MSSELPIIENWQKFLRWLFETLDKLPKKTRFTYVDRITNTALDFLESLVEARYSKNVQKLPILNRGNLQLEKLRIFLRLSYENKYISLRAYEYSAKELESIGRQLGAWRKEVQTRYET